MWAWLRALKVFPLALCVGAYWGFFSPFQGLWWDLFGFLSLGYLLGLWLLGFLEALAGPRNEGQTQPELETAAKVVGGLGPCVCLLMLFYGSEGMLLLAFSVYYAGVQFLSEQRLTWVTFGLGWFSCVGHVPGVSGWEALVLYPLAAFVTVGGLSRLLRDEAGLRRR